MLSVEIVTPSKVSWTGTVAEVQAPGIGGEFGALPDHTPMLSVTRPGVVTLYGTDGSKTRMVVGGGFAEVGPDRVTLLVDLCEDASGVDKAAAAEELKAAQARLEQAEPGTGAWEQARKDMELSSARLEA